MAAANEPVDTGADTAHDPNRENALPDLRVRAAPLGVVRTGLVRRVSDQHARSRPRHADQESVPQRVAVTLHLTHALLSHAALHSVDGKDQCGRRHIFEEAASTVTLRVVRSAADPFPCCRRCGVSTRQVHDAKERRVRDLPWGEWRVWLIVTVHRVPCRRCGVTTEALPFLEGKHPYTRRFAEAVARECEDAAVNRVAARWGVSAQTVRRIDKRRLQACRRRPRTPLRWMGVDEIFWRKGRCLTVVSDLELGAPLWAGPERKQETLDRFFTEKLPPRRRRAVRAVCGHVEALPVEREGASAASRHRVRQVPRDEARQCRGR